MDEARPMSRLLSAAGSLVDRIKVNVLSRETRADRVVWIKRRRRSAGPILACANRFFRLAGNPVRAIGDLAEWQRWEVECFERLHGGSFRAFAEGNRVVGADEMPGVNLTVPLDAGLLEPRMSAAAGRELRRAHGGSCAAFSGGWSHGDPHLGNFIYEAATDCARLIDFEVIHDADLDPDARHADDLLVFLQDLVGRVGRERWLPNAHAFLSGYDRPEIVARLRGLLDVPRGIPRLWWMVRTTYLPASELHYRLEALRRALEEGSPALSS
jgi:hypothetical protein